MCFYQPYYVCRLLFVLFGFWQLLYVHSGQSRLSSSADSLRMAELWRGARSSFPVGLIVGVHSCHVGAHRQRFSALTPVLYKLKYQYWRYNICK